MFRFYINSEYRKLYNQLTAMDLLNDSMAIKLTYYQQYFHHLVIVDPSINKHIQLISKQKLTYMKCVKIVIFLHTWLQSTCVVQDSETVLEFINFLFKQISNMAEKLKGQRRAVSSKKISKSVVFKEQIQNNQQLQMTKQLFILQEVLPPYLYYLQKLISIFDFYNSLKKNFIKPMNPSEIWVLINILRCVLKVTNKVPSICKFIKKSFRPIAEAITYALIEDTNYFYPKLYKYCYGEASKLRACFFDIQNRLGEQQAFKKTIESVQFLNNLLEEVTQINKSLRILTQLQIVQQLDNLYTPKLIDVAGNEFQMIFQLNLLKKTGYPSNADTTLTTPKFLRLHSSKSTLKTEQKDQSIQSNLYVFRDVSNQNEQIITFRKQKAIQRVYSLKSRLQQIIETQPKSVC